MNIFLAFTNSIYPSINFGSNLAASRVAFGTEKKWKEGMRGPGERGGWDRAEPVASPLTRNDEKGTPLQNCSYVKEWESIGFHTSTYEDHVCVHLLVKAMSIKGLGDWRSSNGRNDVLESIEMSTSETRSRKRMKNNPRNDLNERRWSYFHSNVKTVYFCKFQNESKQIMTSNLLLNSKSKIVDDWHLLVSTGEIS